jgi:ABC-type transport system substrate-binding protein
MTAQRTRRVGGGLLACATVALVSACASGSATTAPGGTPKGSAPSQVSVGFAAKIVTLDGDQAVDQTSLAAMHLIDGNLYELGAAGRVFPLLARSARSSSDGLTWTFQLKPGLEFSDGSPLTSADVKATFERAQHDKTNAYAGFVAPISRIATPSPTTVVFHLDRPYPSLPTVLSQPEMTIYPARGLERGSSFFDAPISAGPYELQSWGGGPQATFVRNPHYAGPRPGVRTVQFETIADFNARLSEVQSGQLDFAYDIPPSVLAHVSSPLIAKLTPLYGFISMPTNDTRAPFNQLGVRRAIAAAINRAEINDTVWNGKTTPLAGFWPSTMDGYDPAIQTTPNLGAARADLRGTSCNAGCSITLLYSAADTWAEPTATIISQDLKAIGIDVTLLKQDDPTVNQDLASGKFQAAMTFLYDYNNVPDGLLTYALTSTGGLNANFTGFRPPPAVQHNVTTAIEQGGSARSAALQQTNQLFLKYQPFTTLLTHVVGTVSRLSAGVVSLDSGGFVDVGGA